MEAARYHRQQPTLPIFGSKPMENVNNNEDGARATDERDSFIPRAYNKEWPLLATSRDQGNPKHKRNRGPNAVKKLTDDLDKMKARIEENKKTKGGKTKKSKKRKRKAYKRKSRRQSRKRNSRKRKTRRKKRGGAISAPMAYKKRVDRQEEKKQWTLNREMQTAKMKHNEKNQEEIKKKLRTSFNRQAYWKTPGNEKNKDAIAGFHVRKAMPGIEAAIKGKTLVPRKTRQTRSSSAGRKKRKTRRKRTRSRK